MGCDGVVKCLPGEGVVKCLPGEGVVKCLPGEGVVKCLPQALQGHTFCHWVDLLGEGLFKIYVSVCVGKKRYVSTL